MLPKDVQGKAEESAAELSGTEHSPITLAAFQECTWFLLKERNQELESSWLK